MAMRDPNEWAESLSYAMVMYDETEPDRDYLAIVIREAQEDGARAEREKAPSVAETISRIEHWTHVYGASLCPRGADTYGEGMRDAKEQVGRIIQSGGSADRDAADKLRAQVTALTERAERAEAVSGKIKEVFAQRLENIKRSYDVDDHYFLEHIEDILDGKK